MKPRIACNILAGSDKCAEQDLKLLSTV